MVVSLTVFQSSFLLFLAFDIMHGAYICLAQSCDFVTSSNFSANVKFSCKFHSK